MGLDMLDLRWEERDRRVLGRHDSWGCSSWRDLCGSVHVVELCPLGDVPIVWARDSASGSYRGEWAHIQGGVVGRAHQRLGVLGPAMRSTHLGMRFVV